MKQGLSTSVMFFLFLICIAAAVQAQKTPRYKELPNFDRVNETLFRGAQPRSGGLQKLAALGIKTIINLRDDDQRAQAEEKQARNAGLYYVSIPFPRLGRPDDAQIRQVLAVINTPEKQPVFVHCKHGADRTGLVIAVYRISHDGWTSREAKAEAKRHGMKFWQIGMKDYISDFFRDQQKKEPAQTQSRIEPYFNPEFN